MPPKKRKPKTVTDATKHKLPRPKRRKKGGPPRGSVFGPAILDLHTAPKTLEAPVRCWCDESFDNTEFYRPDDCGKTFPPQKVVDPTLKALLMAWRSRLWAWLGRLGRP